MKALCECGCGNPAPITRRTDSKRGLRKGDPARFCVGHSKKLSISNCYKPAANGCWIWQGAKNTEKGYGRIEENGVRKLAHRWMYEQKVGPIPDGKQLDHLCQNKMCVNPEHLEPVTNAENVRRAPKTKLTPDLVRQIRTTPEMTGAEWGRIVGMGKDAINGVRRGDSWKDIDPPRMVRA